MSKKSGFLLGTVIGSTVAAVTALLLAPKSGKELQVDLAKKVDELKEKVMDLKDSAMDQGFNHDDDFSQSLSSDLEEDIQLPEDSLVDFKDATENLKEQFQEEAAALKEDEGKEAVDDIVIDATEEPVEKLVNPEEDKTKE